MKNMLSKLSKVSAKVRMTVLTCCMVFFFVGLQQAEAQKNGNYIPSAQATQVLETEVGNLKEAKASEPSSAALENPVEAMKILYYGGVAQRLIEGMSTAEAIETNHTSFVALAPTISGTANALKAQVQGLLTQ